MRSPRTMVNPINQMRTIGVRRVLYLPLVPHPPTQSETVTQHNTKGLTFQLLVLPCSIA